MRRTRSSTSIGQVPPPEANSKRWLIRHEESATRQISGHASLRRTGSPGLLHQVGELWRQGRHGFRVFRKWRGAVAGCRPQFRGRATLEGAVVDSKDQPVQDAVVVALPDIENRNRRDLFKRASTDQRGHFVLRGVRPGMYTVLAFDELEEDYHDPEVIKPYEDKGQAVRVDKAQHKSALLRVVTTSD